MAASGCSASPASAPRGATTVQTIWRRAVAKEAERSGQRQFKLRFVDVAAVVFVVLIERGTDMLVDDAGETNMCLRRSHKQVFTAVHAMMVMVVTMVVTVLRLLLLQHGQHRQEFLKIDAAAAVCVYTRP